MEQTNGNGKAVASLVLGIISIVCVTGFFYTSLIGVVTGILAIIFGNKARRDRRLRVRHRRPVHVCAVICQLQLLYDLCQPGNQLLLLVGL